MRWNNVTGYSAVDLTAEQAQSILLPPITGTLHVYLKHSGYDFPAVFGTYPEDSQPPESDLEIHEILSACFLDDDCKEIVLTKEQVDKILDGGEVFELICENIMEAD